MSTDASMSWQDYSLTFAPLGVIAGGGMLHDSLRTRREAKLDGSDSSYLRQMAELASGPAAAPGEFGRKVADGMDTFAQRGHIKDTLELAGAAGQGSEAASILSAQADELTEGIARKQRAAHRLTIAGAVTAVLSLAALGGTIPNVDTGH